MQAINVLEELRSGRLDPTLLDVFFAYRLLLGRQPEFTGPDSYARRRGNGGLSDFVLEFIASEEFANKWTDLPALHRTGDLIVRTDLPNGLVLNFFARDWAIGWHIAMQRFERSTERVVSDHMQPGGICLDIGANIGYFSLLMAKAGAAQIYALEPFESVHNVLVRNIKDNGLNNIIPVNKAAAELSGRHVRLHYEEAGFNTGNMFVPAREDSMIALKHPSVGIETIAADDLVPESKSITFVKIDVEGSEINVIKGMRRILKQNRPTLLVECNPFCLRTMSNTTPEELIAEIQSHKYKVLTEERTEFLLDGTNAVRNMLCLPQ